MDAADHQPDAGALRVRGDEPECRPALEHRLLRPAHAADLEQVVHDPDRVEADIVRSAHDPLEVTGELRRAAGERERRNLQAELHVRAPLAG